MNDPDETLFAAAVDIPHWLARDRETPYAQRLHRDRTIAAALSAQAPLPRVRAWWRRLPQDTRGAAPEGVVTRRLERGRRLIALLMVVLGGLAGLGAASAVLHYDGAWPVNVVTVLATLVLLQLFLVCFTMLLMLPRTPGLAAFQDLLAEINPAALVASLYRRVRGLDDGPGRWFLWRGARGPAAARFARWQMLVWSQLAAVAFNAAVLATAAGLIAFTDLAFGWSTTLAMNSADALRMTDALSTPWRSFWPEAVPHASLIEQSRFFRLASSAPTNAPAAELTGWWPFLLAAILFYGLAPRCVLLAAALLRLRVATTRLLLDDPLVKALLDRMASCELALRAADAEPASCDAARAAPAPPQRQLPAAAIVWSGALPTADAPQWVASHLARRATSVHEAGGARTLAMDEAMIDAVALCAPDAVLVLVRAWEAPQLDLRDLLELLRARLGPACSLIVTPVGVACAAATEGERTMWSRWTATIADPALYLEAGA